MLASPAGAASLVPDLSTFTLANTFAAVTNTPEPGTSLLLLSGLALAAIASRKSLPARVPARLLTALLVFGATLSAQSTQNRYIASNATGQLTLVRAVNLSQLGFASTN